MKPLVILLFSFFLSTALRAQEIPILSFDELNQKIRTEAKAEVLVVNFWATWCPPCIAEMPDFNALYADYGSSVQFYFVSNERHRTVQEFFEKNNYKLPNYKMLTAAPKELQGKTLPTTYVIDTNGSIVLRKVGSARWNSSQFRKTLDDLLAKN